MTESSLADLERQIRDLRTRLETIETIQESLIRPTDPNSIEGWEFWKYKAIVASMRDQLVELTEQMQAIASAPLEQ